MKNTNKSIKEEKQLGTTLEMGIQMLISEPEYVPPVFVVDGYDSKGELNSGVVQLQTKSDVQREELLLHVVALAGQSTTLEPYLWKLDAVFYLEKSVIDVEKHGARSKHEVICIVCLDVQKQAFTSKVFSPLKNQYGEHIGVQMIGHAEDFHIDTTIAQDALFTYVKTYKEYHP